MKNATTLQRVRKEVLQSWITAALYYLYKPLQNKIILAVVTCLIFTTSANAQYGKLNALKDELKNHTANDIQKLEILNKLAWKYQYVQLDTALLYAKHAKELAGKLGNVEGLTEAYNTHALIMCSLGKYEDAQSEVKKSIEINNGASKQNLAFSHVILLQSAENDSAAKNQYTVIYNMYKQLHDEKGIAILNNYYLLYLRSLDKIKALDYNRRAIEAFGKMNNEEWLSWAYMCHAGCFNLNSQYDSALFYTAKSEEINNRLDLNAIQLNVYGIRALVYLYQANYPLAIKNQLSSIRCNEKVGDKRSLDYDLNNIAMCYNEIGDFEKAIYYLKLQLPIAQSRNDLYTLSGCYQEFGNAYMNKQQYKLALTEYHKAMEVSKQRNDKGRLGECHRMLGDALSALQQYDSSVFHYHQAINISKEINSQWEYCKTLISLSKTLYAMPDQQYRQELTTIFNTGFKNDLAISYAKEALELVLKTGELDMQRDAYKVLSELYESKNEMKQSFSYYKKYAIIKDSISSTEKTRSIANLQMQYESEKKEQQIVLLKKENQLQQQEAGRQKTTRNAFIGGMVMVVLITGVAYNRYKTKQITNRQLAVNLQRLELTQQQLIEQERQASLGALTAGIAHEIKNPLNFINNFSELNTEILEDLPTAINAAEESKMLNYLKINFEKITEHGARADSIVNNMLAHSNNEVREKELTDVNELCNEYFRISYKSVRVTNPLFKCELTSTLDTAVPKVSMMAQDFSRVFINLFTNAFYAVNEHRTINPSLNPEVSLTTQYNEGLVDIIIRDNGTGMSDEVREKIFEPFYTTKPAGEGTGLGLSLSFDIVKAHNGKIEVTSKEKEYTQFKITLPTT